MRINYVSIYGVVLCCCCFCCIWWSRHVFVVLEVRCS